ncbi:MAG TPA: hypothetical protein VKA15_14020, partial [Isosphaeraceae bacterium]|nr:hypothetical protein [Isosphaeraceae bacterium]
MKFLSRARKFLQGFAAEPAAKVQYFNVVCAAGHRVRGERTEGYQALRCPACGDGVFVLPRSPLPEPVAPARPQSAKAAGTGGGWPQEGPVELTDGSRVSVEVGEEEGATNGAEIIWEDVADEFITRPGPSTRHRDPDSEEADIDRSRRPVETSAAGAGAPDAAGPVRARPKQRDKRAQPRGPDQVAAGAERDLNPRSAREATRARPRVTARRTEDLSEAVVEPRPISRQRALHTLI